MALIRFKKIVNLAKRILAQLFKKTRLTTYLSNYFFDEYRKTLVLMA